MKLKFLLLLFMTSYLSYIEGHVSSAVTCAPEDCGRFGDQLFLYCKGKIYAKKLGMAYMHRQFQYDYLLQLSVMEQLLTQQAMMQFTHAESLDLIRNPLKLIKPSTLYYTRFYDGGDPLQELFVDPILREELRRLISPRVAVQYINLPADKMTVAVHVRKGGGFDSPLYSKQRYNTQELIHTSITSVPRAQGRFQDILNTPKFPPEQFYIDQIIQLSEELNDTPLYVYLFTDDQNPQQLKFSFETAVGKSNITFDARTQHDFRTTFIDDFFNMACFDYLIRPESAFSIVAQIIGHHKKVIFPRVMHWHRDVLVVHEVGYHIMQ